MTMTNQDIYAFIAALKADIARYGDTFQLHHIDAAAERVMNTPQAALTSVGTVSGAGYGSGYQQDSIVLPIIGLGPDVTAETIATLDAIEPAPAVLPSRFSPKA